jgi:hypothetical protein
MVEERALRIETDDKVEVRIGSGVAAGHGSEDANIVRAVSFCDSEDHITMLL